MVTCMSKKNSMMLDTGTKNQQRPSDNSQCYVVGLLLNSIFIKNERIKQIF